MRSPKTLRAALITTLALAAIPDAASAVPRIKITAKPAVAAPGDRIVVSGRISGVPTRAQKRVRVVLEERARGRWTRRTTARLATRATFAARWRLPATRANRSLRVRLMRGRKALAKSRAWTLDVRLPAPALAPPGPAQPTPVATAAPTTAAPSPPGSPQTKVIGSTAVIGAPAPGQGGELRLDGSIAVAVGDVLASGIGPQAPYGFLLKATAVRSENGQTVVAVVPATLLEALPEGDIDRSFKLQPAAGRSLRRSMRSAIECESGGELAVDGHAELGAPDFDIDVDWGFFKVNSAEFTASVTAAAGASLVAEGAASCSVGPIEIAEFKFAPITFSIGPVPVVLLPEVDVELSGGGTVGASVASNIEASVTAKAGARFEDGQFTPISELSRNFGFQRPAPAGTAQLTGTVSPQLEVLFYGAVGPEFSVNAGLELNADPFAEPWWWLDGTLSVTGEMEVPVLGLESGLMTLYEDRWRLAEARPVTADVEMTFDVTDSATSPSYSAGDDACTYSAVTANGRATLSTKSTRAAELIPVEGGLQRLRMSDTEPALVSGSISGSSQAVTCTAKNGTSSKQKGVILDPGGLGFPDFASADYVFDLPADLRGQPVRHGGFSGMVIAGAGPFVEWTATEYNQEPQVSYGSSETNFVTLPFTAPTVGESNLFNWVSTTSSGTVTSMSNTTQPGSVSDDAEGSIVITGGATYSQTTSGWLSNSMIYEGIGPQEVTVDVTWTITIDPGEPAPLG